MVFTIRQSIIFNNENLQRRENQAHTIVLLCRANRSIHTSVAAGINIIILCLIRRDDNCNIRTRRCEIVSSSFNWTENQVSFSTQLN